jgi:hypothetical protein
MCSTLSLESIGVGIETARYGHRVTFAVRELPLPYVSVQSVVQLCPSFATFRDLGDSVGVKVRLKAKMSRRCLIRSVLLPGIQFVQECPGVGAIAEAVNVVIGLHVGGVIPAGGDGLLEPGHGPVGLGAGDQALGPRAGGAVDLSCALRSDDTEAI